MKELFLFLLFLLVVSCFYVPDSAPNKSVSTEIWSLRSVYGVPPGEADNCAKCISDIMDNHYHSMTSMSGVQSRAKSDCTEIYSREYTVLLYKGMPVTRMTPRHEQIMDSLMFSSK